jgi:hypothetical protein
MSMIQLTYASRPFGFDPAMLAGILLDARRCNARDGITGALIARQDLFLQLLEGPADAVEAAYQRIARDDRHIEVRPLTRQETDTRLFPDWAMRDDPVRSWMWSMEEVANGALRQASEPEILGVFERLRCEPVE